jgi:hypothetical protein
MSKQILPLLHLLPSIKRSRGGYLYDHNGNRFLDLWLEDGFLYHGHQVHQMLQVLKNTISQNSLNPYPNLWHSKALKALMQTFSPKHILCSSHALADTFSQPWQKSPSGHYLLRLAMPLPTDTQVAKLAIPLAGYHCYLFFQDNLPTTIQSSILPAALARLVLLELSLAKPELPPALPFTTPNWQWHGRYFSSTLQEKDYRTIFSQALEQNILLPPHHQAVGLWKSELFSDGQNAHLTKFLQSNC